MNDPSFVIFKIVIHVVMVLDGSVVSFFLSSVKCKSEDGRKKDFTFIFISTCVRRPADGMINYDSFKYKPFIFTFSLFKNVVDE